MSNPKIWNLNDYHYFPPLLSRLKVEAKVTLDSPSWNELVQYNNEHYLDFGPGLDLADIAEAEMKAGRLKIPRLPNSRVAFLRDEPMVYRGDKKFFERSLKGNFYSRFLLNGRFLSSFSLREFVDTRIEWCGFCPKNYSS